jgi:hypothetical protein
MSALCFSINELVKAANGAASRRKVYEAINAGSLKARKNGKRTVVLASDAVEWLQSLPLYQPKRVA